MKIDQLPDLSILVSGYILISNFNGLGRKEKMYRMALAIIAFIMLISFLALRAVVAQTMSEGTEVTSPESQTPSQGTQAPSQGTNVIQSQPNYPLIDQAGRVYLQENLDSFGLSTLGSADNEYNTEGSTLGTRTKPRSNLEVNQPREKKQVKEATQEGVQPGGEATIGVSGEESIESTPEEPTEEISPSSLGKSSGLYTWKDKNGVVHATNNFGSIPPEYREQPANEPKKGESE